MGFVNDEATEKINACILRSDQEQGRRRGHPTGGSAADAAPRAEILVSLHRSGPLRARRPSTSAGTGTRSVGRHGTAGRALSLPRSSSTSSEPVPIDQNRRARSAVGGWLCPPVSLPLHRFSRGRTGHLSTGCNLYGLGHRLPQFVKCEPGCTRTRVHQVGTVEQLFSHVHQDRS